MQFIFVVLLPVFAVAMLVTTLWHEIAKSVWPDRSHRLSDGISRLSIGGGVSLFGVLLGFAVLSGSFGVLGGIVPALFGLYALVIGVLIFVDGVLTLMGKVPLSERW